MMLSGLRVSWARPAAARFISLRWVFISLARTRRICSSEDLARFLQARPEPRAARVASRMIIVRNHKSRVAAASSPSVDMVRTRPCSVRLAIRDWSSFSSMPRCQKGRRDRPPGSRDRPSRPPGGGPSAIWLAGSWGGPASSGGGGPRRGKSRPGSLMRLVSSLKGMINVLVTPSELRLAPRSTGLTRVTLRCPQCSPSRRRSSRCASMDRPAEATRSLAALRRTMEISSLDLTSSLVRPPISSLSTGSSRSCGIAPRKRMPRMMRAEGVGNVLGTVAQIGPGGLLDAQVLLDLPGDDQHPDGCQEGVNQRVAASQFHALCRGVLRMKSSRSRAFGGLRS